jgi:hypothetical protein
VVVKPSPLEQLGLSGTAIIPLRISVGRKHEENAKPRKNDCCCGAEESKGSDGEEEKDDDAAAALPYAVAPVGAPSAYYCGGERSVCCCDGAEGSKGGDGEEETDGDAAAALSHAVAPVGAPSLYSCGGAEERKGCDGGWERRARRRQGFTASGEVTENRAAARSSAGSV